MPFLLPLLAVLAAWIGFGLILELLAWRADGLGMRPAPAIFRAEGKVDPDGVAHLAFLGDLQRGVADVARPLAAALDAGPTDLLVSSGDLVSHGEAPYYGIALDAFERAGVTVPTRVVPGNHDLQPRGLRNARPGEALFVERFGATDFFLEVGPVLVVGLDDALGPVPVDVLAELDRRLEAWLPRPWILVVHRPLRRLGEDDARAEEDLLPLLSRVEAHPPLLVVAGHDHVYRERVVEGVRHVVNAHGGDVHGLGLRRPPFELLRVDVGTDGLRDERITRHARRPSPRVTFHQLAVRAWSSRRRGLGAFLTWPAARLLDLFSLRAP